MSTPYANDLGWDRIRVYVGSVDPHRPGPEYVIDLREGWPGPDLVALKRWWKARS